MPNIMLKPKNTENTTSDVIAYIKDNLDVRLKFPFVSKDYSAEDKKHLLAGLKMALSFEKMHVKDIIAIHKAMNPDVQAKMRFLIRRGPRVISTNKYQDGLLETLDWLEQHQAGYGPRFEIGEIGKDSTKHFESIAQLRKGYASESNSDLATKLESELKAGKERIVFCIVPIFDSLNPHTDMDLKPCTDPYTDPSIDLYVECNDYIRRRGFQIYNVVEPKFLQLVDEFNSLQRPAIEQIAAFIKSMVLLHPFPDGNGRTFTLGVLNSLLYNNGYGICLDLDPRISCLANSTLASNIIKNLVPLNPGYSAEQSVIKVMQACHITPAANTFESKRNGPTFFALGSAQSSTLNDSQVHDASIGSQGYSKKIIQATATQ